MKGWASRLRPRRSRAGSAPVAPRTRALFGRGGDVRRGEITHGNTLTRFPDLRRRPTIVPLWLNPWVVGRVERVYRAGAADAAAYRLVDQQLAALLDGEWQALDREYRERLGVYHAIHAQQQTSVVETETTLEMLRAELALVAESHDWNRAQLRGADDAPRTTDVPLKALEPLLPPPSKDPS